MHHKWLQVLEVWGASYFPLASNNWAPLNAGNVPAQPPPARLLAPFLEFRMNTIEDHRRGADVRESESPDLIFHRNSARRIDTSHEVDL